MTRLRAFTILAWATLVPGLRRGNLHNGARLLSATAGTGVGSAQPHVLVPIANGSEEIEAVTIIDTLVRGGVKVTSATVHSDDLQVVCSRGVKLVADRFIKDCAADVFDMIVCPGGMPGSEHLRDSADLTRMLKAQKERGAWVGAICAAPAVVFKSHGILDASTPATGYPAEKFKTAIGSQYDGTSTVLVSGRVVTSQGPGTAMAFSLKLIELLVSKEKAAAVAKEMLTPVPP
jgi:protein deglycase